MSERIIEQIEANSLEEAKRKIDTPELIVLEVSLLSHGREETVEAVADTVEEAFVKAQSKVPAEAKIERKIKVVPKQVMLQAQGDNEESAGKGKAEAITSVSLLKKGRKGLWGFGRTPNVYEVVISQQAVVELRFREQAKFRVKVRDYSAEELFQSIQELRRRNAQWTEILQVLNPKNDSKIQESLMKIRELNPLSVLDTIEGVIEDVCRKNEKASWRMVIEEANRRAEETHRQAAIARARELREQEVRLRGLDVEIAESFGFYISLNWYARSHKEPTGIPRYTVDYDYHRPADERLRKTIPRYSTDEGAFSEVERSIKELNLYELYLQLLFEEGQDETAATLEQKCIVALKTRKLKMRGR